MPKTNGIWAIILCTLEVQARQKANATHQELCFKDPLPRKTKSRNARHKKLVACQIAAEIRMARKDLVQFVQKATSAFPCPPSFEEGNLGFCKGPRGSRYLILKELGLRVHDCHGFSDLIP